MPRAGCLLLSVFLSAHALALAAPPPPAPLQLTLENCGTASGIAWSFSGSADGSSPGAFTLVGSSPPLCVSYDASSTNLLASPCGAAGAPAQSFTLRAAAGQIYSAAEGLCWDAQYYGNTSGTGLGLYGCTDESWGRFAYDAAAARITNTQLAELCVSGAPPPPPVPTAAQLAWTRSEVSLMISFDMITMLPEVPNPQHFCIQAGGDSGFPVPPASRFAPAEDGFTDSWMAAAAAADAKYTLLVASHCSGFLQWQSNVTLPDGSQYNYTVKQSGWRGGKGDVVEDYVASSRKASLPFGFYLTWNYAYLFNWGPSGFAHTPLQPGMVNVTAEQYHAIMLATIEEVWSRYPGEMREIWFDGGENNVAMNDLIARWQPQAIATDGTQPPNLARLVGRESGYAPYPVWSTAAAAATDGSGDPAGRLFCPAEADTPIAQEDAWFWKPSTTYRPLAELKAVYRNTVGANSVLELGVLPDSTGAIPADQMAVLQALGDYIRGCHGPAAALNATAGVGAAIRLDFAEAVVDRVILQEDQAAGQLVQAFTVAVLPPGGYDPEPVVVATGSAIGNKRILYFASGPTPAKAVIVTATSLYPGVAAANWRNVAAYAPCPLE